MAEDGVTGLFHIDHSRPIEENVSAVNRGAVRAAYAADQAGVVTFVPHLGGEDVAIELDFGRKLTPDEAKGIQARLAEASNGAISGSTTTLDASAGRIMLIRIGDWTDLPVDDWLSTAGRAVESLPDAPVSAQRMRGVATNLEREDVTNGRFVDRLGREIAEGGDSDNLRQAYAAWKEDLFRSAGERGWRDDGGGALSALTDSPGAPTGRPNPVAQAATQAAGGAIYGAMNPEDDESRAEAALRGAGSMLLSPLTSRLQRHGGVHGVRSAEDEKGVAAALRKSKNQLAAESSVRLKKAAQAKLDEVTERRAKAAASPEATQAFKKEADDFVAHAEATLGDVGSVKRMLKEIPGLGTVLKGVDALTDPRRPRQSSIANRQSPWFSQNPYPDSRRPRQSTIVNRQSTIPLVQPESLPG